MAKALLQEISQDEIERARHRSRAKWVNDYHSDMSISRAEGRTEGRAEGRVEGRVVGETVKVIDLIKKNMQKDCFPLKLLIC